jgi:arsenate reductase (glutaredoxin)
MSPSLSGVSYEKSALYLEIDLNDRNARGLLRNDLGVELDERDYAKNPFNEAELRDLFKGRDPRDYLNPKSPAFKSIGLKDKALTEDEAFALMAKEPNLIKRPLTIAGRTIVAGFDRDRLRELFG